MGEISFGEDKRHGIHREVHSLIDDVIGALAYFTGALFL